ncbi:hypothetical protein [Agrobacterium rubi]|uniref:Phage tail protein n=1 Tax=Agrobacterium rubi TaxID=28099 RepID=A0ABX2IXV6_9HYPH|nr:hypothetical protein [Agrobacterium rubi]NTF35571.1 hypothetical protein [Agrobacterium rubi]
MPRVNGIFTLLSGSKGSPNTTIQSATYNSQLDDFAQTLNLPQPITAGGTDATTASGARQNLGLVPVASSGSASDLTTGTLADARLPGNMASAKTFSGGVTVSNSELIVSSVAPIIRMVETDNSNKTWFVVLDGGAWTVRENSTAETRLSIDPGGGVSALKSNGNVVWNAANDGAGSGLDADVLDGQQGSFYQNASNLNAGTIADARLPSTQAGKVFTTDVTAFSNVFVCTLGGVLEVGTQNGASNPAVIDFHTSASVVDYNARIIASGNVATNGGANLELTCQNLTHNNALVWDVGNLGYLGGGEAEAGVSETKRVWSSADVRRAIAGSRTETANQSYVINGTGSVAHGLGFKPNWFMAKMICLNADKGYSAGDEVDIASGGFSNNSSYGVAFWATNTTFNWRIAANGVAVIDKSTGNLIVVSPSNWALRFRGGL